MKKKTLLKYREYFDKEFRMKESELNAMMSVVADPIENVYKIESQKDIDEIQRIIRIFEISKAQRNKHKMLSIKNKYQIFKLIYYMFRNGLVVIKRNSFKKIIKKVVDKK